MRKVELRPAGAAFDEWNAKATAARNVLLKSWIGDASTHDEAVAAAAPWKPTFNESIYREFRQVFLLEAFHKKCAYCEANHSDGYPVQVEHYRPKAQVTENRKPISHSGYFWLAYEWWNLIPSCAHCNTNHTDPSGKTSHPGKKNEFPIAGTRTVHPCADPQEWLEQLDNEKPILLNPYFDEPQEHMAFDAQTGAVIQRTDRGRATIEVCDLNRMSQVEKRLALKMDSLAGMIDRIVHGEHIDLVVSPAAEYSVWRRNLVQNQILEICSKAGLTASSCGPVVRQY